MITLGAFYLVIPATLDDRVCPAHNRSLFPLVVPYSISSCAFPREHCTKVYVALALDDSCYTPYDPHALYNVLRTQCVSR